MKWDLTRKAPPPPGAVTLATAVLSRSLDLVRDRLHEATSRDAAGCTALMLAAQCGYQEMVAPLAAEKTLRDSDGYTALHHAIASGSEECALLLLAEAEIRDNAGRTPLDHGILRGRHDLAIKLAEATKGPGEDLFDAALRGGHVYCAAAILARSRSKDYTQGYSLLAISVVLNDDTLFARFRSQAGMRDNRGWTALMHAVLCGRTEYVRSLVPDEARLQSTKHVYAKKNFHVGTTALMIAVMLGRTELVELLARTEAGLTTDKGGTALMAAAEFKQLNSAKLLLAEARSQDRSGETALMKAAKAGNAALVELLAGYEETMTDSSGRTALMHGVKKGRKAIVKLLAKEVGICDAMGWTALMYAVLSGQELFVPTLRSESGAVSTEYCWSYPPGTTALMIAADTGRAAASKHLAPTEKGLFNSEGRCALMLAMAKGHDTCVFDLFQELHFHDKDGVPCVTKLRALYLAEKDSSPDLARCYERFWYPIAEAFCSLLDVGLLRRIVLLLPRFLAGPTGACSSPELLDCVWAALFAEHEGALDALDSYLEWQEDQHGDDSCCVCLSHQPDAVFVPCHHLVACGNCIGAMVGAGLSSSCPYCKTPFDEVLYIEAAPSL